MRWLVLLIGLPVSIGLVIVSMIANWRFGIRLGAEDGDAWAYGLASVCADGLKVILPFAIAWAWQRRQVAEWLSGASLWLVITIYSLVSALSFAAVNRDEIAGRRIAASQSYADLRHELDAKRREREALGTIRPLAAIDADLKSSEQQPRYATSRQCTDTPTRDLRLYCERHFKLKGEEGTARQAERLDEALARIKERLNTLPQSASQRTVDPQVDLFKSLSGLSDGTIKAALAVLVCLLIELGSGLGLFVVISCHRALRDDVDQSETEPLPLRYAQLLLPAASDADWLAERVQRVEGGTIGAAELYADYRVWMEARNCRNALTVTAFGRWMSALGADREKVGGRVVYRGVKMKAAERVVQLAENKVTVSPDATP